MGSTRHEKETNISQKITSTELILRRFFKDRMIFFRNSLILFRNSLIFFKNRLLLLKISSTFCKIRHILKFSLFSSEFVQNSNEFLEKSMILPTIVEFFFKNVLEFIKIRLIFSKCQGGISPIGGEKIYFL